MVLNVDDILHAMNFEIVKIALNCLIQAKVIHVNQSK